MDRAEIEQVLRLYELGEVRSARPLLAGSGASPKALIECARGRFVLKRREPGRDDPLRVAFTHEVIVHLLRAGFAAPRLIGTRDANNSMAQLEDRVYDLTLYVDARPSDKSPAQAHAAGRALGAMHTALGSFRGRFTETGSAPDPAGALDRAAAALGSTDDARDAAEVFDHARSIRVHQGEWTQNGSPHAGVIHGDYHPHNLLYDDEGVACVFDFDNARVAPCREDLAQAMVQFALRPRETKPGAWPTEPDLSLAAQVLAGYTQTGPGPAVPAPALGAAMAESLVVEWAQATTAGRLGTAQTALAILPEVVRTARWLVEHTEDLARSIAP